MSWAAERQDETIQRRFRNAGDQTRGLLLEAYIVSDDVSSAKQNSSRFTALRVLTQNVESRLVSK